MKSVRKGSVGKITDALWASVEIWLSLPSAVRSKVCDAVKAGKASEILDLVMEGIIEERRQKLIKGMSFEQKIRYLDTINKVTEDMQRQIEAENQPPAPAE